MKFTTLTKDIFAKERSDDRTWVRTVEISRLELRANNVWMHEDGSTPRVDDDMLELIFKLGQNDVAPRVAPSLSLGDLILLADAIAVRIYMVDKMGFKCVNRSELTRRERLAIDFATSAINAAVDHQIEEAAHAIRARRTRSCPNDVESVVEKFRDDVERMGC